MKHLIASKSNRSTAAAAVVSISFFAACGGSDATSATDGDGSLDGGVALGDSGSGDGAGGADGGPLEDTGRAADGSGGGGDEADAGGGGVDATAEGEDAGRAASPELVKLGTAGNFAILAKSGISTVPHSTVTGNLGVSPAAASYITGFSLTADSSNVFSTSPQVTGKVYASDYSPPTPSKLTTAIGDMELAFTDAAGRAPDVTELGAGNIGGMTLTAGVYKWSTGLLIPTNVTLAGKATDVWIFQVAKNLTVSGATHVTLIGGAVPEHVFWQVSGDATLGTTAQFEGIVLCATAISVRTGASIHGRLLAQTAVSIESSTVSVP